MRTAAEWIGMTALMAIYGGAMLVLGISIGMSDSRSAWVALAFWAILSFTLTGLVRAWRR